MADNSRSADSLEASEAPEALLAERIRALREAAELTQGQLAERMTQLGFSMHQTAIAKVELGQRPVRLNEVVGFAAALRVPVTDLLPDTESTPESEALWQELLAAAAQRLELTRRHEAIEAERAILGMQQAELISRLKALEQREAEARRNWQDARAGQEPQGGTRGERARISPATVRELYANAIKCAFPGCDQLLYRVNADGSRILNSQIVHICSIQPGGLRWDPNMSPKELGSVGNLLLLCHTHSREIDRPERSRLYHAEVLRNWKREQLAFFDDYTSMYELPRSLAKKTAQGEHSPEPSMATEEPARAARTTGIDAGSIDPDSPLFWKGTGIPTFGESTFLGTDGGDGAIISMDDGRVLLRVPGEKVGTGTRSKSDKLSVSTLILANYVEFRDNIGYITGSGFSYYNVLELNDPLPLGGLLILECGGMPQGEYGLTLEVLDPENKVISTETFVFKVTKPGDILRIMFKFTLSVMVGQFGMWAVVARHEDRELARLPIVIKQGVPGT
jgi:transcriptional regulator with XRE-family HTH domain